MNKANVIVSSISFKGGEHRVRIVETEGKKVTATLSFSRYLKNVKLDKTTFPINGGEVVCVKLTRWDVVDMTVGV